MLYVQPSLMCSVKPWDLSCHMEDLSQESLYSPKRWAVSIRVARTYCEPVSFPIWDTKSCFNWSTRWMVWTLQAKLNCQWGSSVVTSRTRNLSVSSREDELWHLILHFNTSHFKPLLVVRHLLHTTAFPILCLVFNNSLWETFYLLNLCSYYFLQAFVFPGGISLPPTL